jgi:hypothetical protein
MHGQMNNTAFAEGSTVIDAHDDMLAVVNRPHAKFGPKRQRAMRCGHLLALIRSPGIKGRDASARVVGQGGRHNEVYGTR